MKTTIKILSVIMSFVLFIGFFPSATTVLAQEYNEHIESEEYKNKLLSETVNDENIRTEIVCEVTEKRDEYSKTYKRADGSFTTVFSSTPIHTLKDGKWSEIDNTLQTENDIIKNADGVFDIEFPETITENEKITVTNDGESIAFSVNDIENSQAVVSNQSSEADVVEQDISKTVSAVTYESVDNKTDVQYVVSSGFVKENIIVNDKSAVKDTYSFDIEKGNLTITLDDENNVIFKNTENEIVFTIPAPVMSDAENAVSYDIDVSVSGTDKTIFTLTYTPSKEWLNANDRVYPVVIDPVIVFPSSEDLIIEDTVIMNKEDEPTAKTTNYSNYAEGYICDTDEMRSNILVKFNMDAFSGFKKSNIEVTRVDFLGDGIVYGGNALLKPVVGSWDCETITYADVFPDAGTTPAITYENTVTDYFTGISSQEANNEATNIHFNITSLFRDWLSGKRENTGFAIVPENTSTNGCLFIGGEYAPQGTVTHTFSSYCSVDYVDTSGNNDSFEYLTQEIGRAGAVNVNVFSRGLSLTRSDLSMDGLRMPVNVQFNYNSALSDYLSMFNAVNELYGEAVVVPPYGENWSCSYLQMLTELVEGQYMFYTSEGTIVTFNKKEETVTSEVDGESVETTEIVFEADETSDTGYYLELKDQSVGLSYTNMVVTNPVGEALSFDDNGFVTRINEPEANTDGTYDSITVNYDEENPFVINSVVDGVGRKYVFTYNTQTGLLSEIKCVTANGTPIKAGTTDIDLKITYTYDGNRNLTGVTYPDGKTVTYTYDSNSNLVKVQNIDGYNVRYTYDIRGKVKTITEYANDTKGNYIELTELSNRQIKVDDAYYGSTTYQFGVTGKLQYTFDDKGNYQKSFDAAANDETVFEMNSWETASENLLMNGSFEDASAILSTRAKHWSSGFERVTNDTAPTGSYVYSISSESAVTEFLEQSVEVKNVTPYTLSVDVKSAVADDIDGKLYLKIIATNSSNDTVTKTLSVENAEEWTRYSLTFNPVTENGTFQVSEITACIGFNDSCGAFYIDNVQLESGKGTADYNLIENGSFNNSTDKWSEATVGEENIYGKNVNAVKFEGGLPAYTQSGDSFVINDSVSAITQNVKINGKKGDVYSVGGWFKGLFDDNSLSEYANPEFSETTQSLSDSLAQIKVTYTYNQATTDDTGAESTETLTENFAVDFAPRNNDWQYAVDSFSLKGDVESVDVTVISKNIYATSYATGIELTRNESAVSFSIESDETDITEDTENDIDIEEAQACPCEACEDFDCLCRCTSESDCDCITCKRTSNIEIISGDGRTVTNKSYDGVNYMQSTVAYSENKNTILSETDTNGISTAYTYNENGIIKTVTDGSGNVTSYNTNPVGYITLAKASVNGLTDNALEMAISYIYNGDLLTKTTQGNVDYEYVYDQWGQLKSILIDNISIVNYTYGENEKHTRVTKIIFGSSAQTGFTVEYYYDNETGDIDCVKKYNYVDGEKNTIKYEYIYDNLGTLIAVKDNGTGHYISYTDTGTIVKDGENGNIIYQINDVTPVDDVVDETTESSANEPISITEETADGVVYTHNIYESNCDALTGKTTEKEAVIGGKTIGTQSVSDWFGRTEDVTVMTKNPTDDTVTDHAQVSSQYGYVTENNITTNLISSLNNTVSGTEGTKTVNYSYTYDSSGKITGITSTSNITGMSGSTQYIYDESGQLIKEISETDYTEYAYDSKGNISTRKAYSNNSLVSTDNFTYGAETWEDRLTGYNGKTIAYDSIGNPTFYLGATLTWRGRELESYSKGNIQILYSYDVDGMRYQKIVKTDGVETARYDYVYSEGKLVLVTYTSGGVSDTARFIYDSYGEPRGFILNNTAAYLYVKNAQGDITGIVNENGEVILTCTYDAWGNVNFGSTSMTHMTLAAKLSQINPFTYRGYCYDYDIGMYYLQSRYYDPQICRFINADSTDYLGATGTLLSYNLFAYCENDGVNCLDATGTWAYDVHAGYYVRNAYSDDIKTLKFVKSKRYNYVYGNNKVVYIPYIRYNGTNKPYGTYYWAVNCGIKADYAKSIADACNGVDNLFSGVSWMPYIGDQSWHFNTNWGTNKQDSRRTNSKTALSRAQKHLGKATALKGKARETELKEAFKYIGLALHPLQDISAHTRSVCKYATIPLVVSSNIKGIQKIVYINFWFHPEKVNGIKVDSASEREAQLLICEKETKNLLKILVRKYPILKGV